MCYRHVLLALADTNGNESTKDVKGSGNTYGTKGDCPAGWSCKATGKNKGKCQK